MHRVFTAFALFTVLLLARPAWTEDNIFKHPQVTVSVYNDAHVPAAIVSRAEERAASIFTSANFEVAWVTCTQASNENPPACLQVDEPGHLALRVISDAATVSDIAFGIAFLSPSGDGRYCDVFWKRAEELQSVSNSDLAGILGSVMAHEIGHLLLGSNAHAVSGIMRARWEGEELHRIAMGTLLFTPQQAKRMRGRVRLSESAQRSAQQKSPSS
jgi:hypothetical protein